MAVSSSSSFNATDGDAYELQMGRWSRRLAELFLDFAGPVGTGHVLDLGCGTGSLTLALMARAPECRITGVDFSAAYIDSARRRAAGPRIDFQVGDACAIPFPAGSFDSVLSLLMLHFVPRAPEAVAEMRRVARPGAVVAAAVWARDGLPAHQVVPDAAAALDPRAEQLRIQNISRPMTGPGELAAAWRSAGFTGIREEALTIRMDFAAFDDFWAPYLGGQGPGAAYVDSLDPEARGLLREQVRLAYLDGAPDGPRSYAATAVAVRGIAPA